MCKFNIKLSSMLLKDQCISVTDLRNRTKECLEHLDEGEKYVFVNNKPKAVIIDVEVYESLIRPKFVKLSDDEVTDVLKKKIQKSKNREKTDLVNI